MDPVYRCPPGAGNRQHTGERLTRLELAARLFLAMAAEDKTLKGGIRPDLLLGASHGAARRSVTTGRRGVRRYEEGSSSHPSP